MARDARLLALLGAALVLALGTGSASASGHLSSSIEIAHWNGKAWTRVPSPRVNGRLEAVTADSASDAWAVGIANRRPLALHWTGSSWRPTVVAGPVLSGNGELDAVSASSPKNVWAVGDWNGAR